MVARAWSGMQSHELRRPRNNISRCYSTPRQYVARNFVYDLLSVYLTTEQAFCVATRASPNAFALFSYSLV